MFFLLASFMLACWPVGKSIRIACNRMSARLASMKDASKSNRKDIVNLAVKQNGDYFVDKTRVTSVELRNYLSNEFRTNIHVAVYITGDADATHGMIIDALDLVRQEGIQKVSFAIPGSPQAGTKQ